MKEDQFRNFERGGFRGKLSPALDVAMTSERLAGLKAEISRDGDQVLSAGRHRVVVLDVGTQVAVKAFGKQSAWKDHYDKTRGSKASRSHEAAAFLRQEGVGTPAPLGYLEKWSGSRLLESYYFSSYLPRLTSFKDELIRIYRENPECDRLVSLLEHIGSAIRKMHDAGFWHRDLGNQNMELLETPDGIWGEVQFIDLNRGRLRKDLTHKERAQDFSRIKIPSAMLQVLVRIYWGQRSPQEFTKALGKFRRRFYWWEKSRQWRHPFRAKPVPGPMAYPQMQDIWIWDSQSAQASITMDRRERKRYYPKGRHRRVAGSVLKSGFQVWKNYQGILPEAFAKKITLTGRIGIALEAADLDFEKQREFLQPLGKIPVLLRFCHHEGRSQWQKTVEDLKELHSEGHEIMIALIQDRNAILEPDSWQNFLEYILGEVADFVTQVELCHAVNRTKWGVHSPQEQRVLLEPVVTLKQKYPTLKFTGPACIDFEYHYVLAALDETPEGLDYEALSHHLYVDRRGAPENFQGKFSTVEKCALLRAIARCSPACKDRVIISEVNWPVKGAGIWSPVGATYQSPGEAESPLNVSEEDYGHFMLRYLVLALCSGFVDQVYWWRLVSHGFGLVDERAEGGWRARPGYRMLTFFLETLGSATFLEKLSTENGMHAMKFQAEHGEVVLAWCYQGQSESVSSFGTGAVRDVFGQELKEESSFRLGEAPLYFFS